jgi:hypothetical protein
MRGTNVLTSLSLAACLLYLPGCEDDSPSEPAAGPATTVAFGTLPPQIISGIPFTITVRALDANGMTATGYTGSVTVSKASGPGMLTGTLTRNAVAGVATFNDLVVDTAGTYTFSAASGSLTGSTTSPVTVQPEAVLLKNGTFTSQSGYMTTGSVQILRLVDGSEILRTGSDFSVSSGAGAIGIWLTNAAGAANLNSTADKIMLGVITTGFSGVYEYDIPGGLGTYTHVVSFCEGAQINFGYAELMNP